ncbi:MAG: DUF1501 domain-containing protein [Planctomycetes bacterium]|nr:DUF1501 domain-containing protein [Planctomycetota bacterium]
MNYPGKKTNPTLSRRDFFRQSSCAALGVTGIVNTLSHLLLTKSALAMLPLNDYKALVVLFLFGGNDANNMLIPSATHPSRADYDSARGILAIPTIGMHLLDYPTMIDRQYGLHPDLEPLAELFNSGDLSFVANVGTMVEPIPNRDAFLNDTVQLPPRLFSHSDQQLQWQSSIPDQPFTSGWGGRIADLLNPSYNVPDGKISMSISLAGVNRLMVGSDVIQYTVSSSGITQFAGAGYSTSSPPYPYDKALNADDTYKDNNDGRRLKAFEDIMNYAHAHLLENAQNLVVRRARAAEGFVGDALAAAAAAGVDFDSIFLNAQSKLGDRLKMIAQLIAGRDSLANERQIFFVSIGGYDNHNAQLPAHENLMRELGRSLKAFSTAMKALTVDDKVLTISHSDFARTLTPNKVDPTTAGSDHAWGSHQIVMGGPVDGGKIFGFFPSLVIGGDQDAGTKGRGRWIPTTSVEQYQAVAADWLGVQSEQLAMIFPNLSRFEDPFNPAANLGFIT